MTTLALKKRIFKIIDSSETEKLLKAIYTILEESEPEINLTYAQKAELSRRIDSHKSGKSKSYTLADVKVKYQKRFSKK